MVSCTLSIEAIDMQQNLPKILVSAPVTTISDLQTALINAAPYLNYTSLLQISLKKEDGLTYNIHKTYINPTNKDDAGTYRAFVYMYDPEFVDPGYVSQDSTYTGNPQDEYFIYTGQGTTVNKNETIDWMLAVQGMEHFLTHPNDPRSPAIQWKLM